MKRTNTFVVRPLTEDGEQVLRDLLDASAALWNEINYQRLLRYNDEDGFEGDVWDADSGRWHGPCDSSGTTTNGRGNHTLRKVPKKCAQTRKLPPWVGSRTLNGGILAL